MDSAKKAQQLVTKNVGQGIQGATKLAGATKNRLKVLLGDFNLGSFGNIIVSSIIIYILYKMCWAYLNSFDYNTRMDFIKQSFYYWVWILAIMVAYAALSKRNK